MENFSSYLPACWSEFKGAIGTSATSTFSNWGSRQFANAGGDNAAVMNIYSTNRYEWLVTPTIDLSGTLSYQAEFDIALTRYFSTAAPASLGVDDTVAFVISTDDGATWSRVNILESWYNGKLPSNTGDHITIDLSAYTGIVKFGFYAASSVSNADNDVFIDNFLVTNLATCAAPSALTASNIMPTSADLAWTENGTATSWAVEYGPSGFAPGTGMMMGSTTNPFSATGLMANTA